MKAIKKITALTLCFVLMLTAAACSNTTGWVYKTQEEELPAGVYITMMLNSFNLARGEYLKQDGLTDYTVKVKDVLAYEIDGQKADTWISQKTQAAAVEYFAVKSQALALGISLSAEEEAAIKASAEQVWTGEAGYSIMLMAYNYYGMSAAQYLQMIGQPEQYLQLLTQTEFEKNGVAQSSLETYLIHRSLSQRLFTHLYGEGGELAPGEEEIVSEFQSGYAKTAYMTIAKQALTGAEEDAAQAALDVDAANKELLAQAEGYLERIKAGEALEDIDFEYQTSIAAEGTEVAQRTLADYSSILIREEDTGDALYEAIISAQPTVFDDTENGVIYIIKPLDILEDSQDLETYRSALLISLKWEEYEQKLAEWGAALNPQSNTKAISKYKPGNLTIEEAN